MYFLNLGVKGSTAVAVAFEEMSTLHANGLEICVQRFGNAHQRKEIEKRIPHFKTNKMFFANDARFPLIYSRMSRDRLRHVLFETC